MQEKNNKYKYSEEEKEAINSKEYIELIKNNPIKMNNNIDKAFSKTEFTPVIDNEGKINMKQPAIWKGFPLSDRVLYSITCGAKCINDNKTKQFPIEEILINKSQTDERLDFLDKYLSLKILKTGTFDIEPCIIHPFVRISIVNLRTGKFLQKKNFEVPAILPNEKNLICSHVLTQNILEFKESYLDFLPPVSTNPCDLRIKGESFAEWNEEIIINDNAKNIFQSDNIIFFEILDFSLFDNAYSSMREYSTEDFILPICWGYLRPLGYSQTYLGKYKLQLYKYKHKRTDLMKKLKKTSTNFIRTPDVLYEFNWFKREKYQTYLEIEINIEKIPSEFDLTKEYYIRKYSNSVFIPECENQRKFNEIENAQLRKRKISKFEDLDVKEKERRILLAKRKRFNGENCIIPDKLLYKFESGKFGCLTQSFSPNGKYLAAACTEDNSITTIKIFNVEDGKFAYHLRGHLNLIHSLIWSYDSSILISGSSDGNVILWQIPHIGSNNIENLDFMDNDKIFKLCNITHPSYVYTLSILPEESKDMIILATGCFDGIVRIFSINFIIDENEYGENKNNKMINSGTNSNFYRSISNIQNPNQNSKNFYSYFHKKSYSHYSLLHEIFINEEFLNVDFFLKTSKSDIFNMNKTSAPLSQTQMLSTEKEKNWNERLKGNLKSSVKEHVKQERRKDEYFKKMKIKKEDFENLKESEKESLIEKTVLDHRHANCIFFDEYGKLYIGDSLGAIHIWEFRIMNSKPICNKIRIISNKELEGDDINKFYIEPGPKRRLIVHSRDNCIRLIDISKEKPKIIIRYFGLKCSKMNIRSVVSPDGQFILSGSEDGKPYLFSLYSGYPIINTKFECNFVDPILDVSWNNYYNMISVGGFGHNCPILVYVHERQEFNKDHVEYKYKSEDEILMRKSGDDHNRDKLVSAYKDNFSDFTKEFKAIIEPQIKN
jgi:WD40 repeat protein